MANDKNKNKPAKRDMSKKKEMYLREPTDKEVEMFSKRFRLDKNRAKQMMRDKVEKLRKRIEDYEAA